MAAATAITGCSSTTNIFLKGTAPIWRRCLFLPSVTTSSSCGSWITNKHGSSIPVVGKFTLSRSLPPLASNIIHITSAPSRRRMQLLRNCTDTASTSINTAAKSDGEGDGDDDTIRESANTLDIRVGKILKAWRHEEADSLYVEEVDIGEPEPRTICSGLVKYIPLHLLQERSVIVIANLKPRNMRGVKSFGMLMAASDGAHEKVELLVPPQDALPGDRVWFGSLDEKENLPDVASPNQVQKKKIWEQVQPHLKTDDSCVAKLGNIHHMRTSAGVITCESLKNANIS